MLHSNCLQDDRVEGVEEGVFINISLNFSLWKMEMFMWVYLFFPCPVVWVSLHSNNNSWWLTVSGKRKLMLYCGSGQTETPGRIRRSRSSPSLPHFTILNSSFGRWQFDLEAAQFTNHKFTASGINSSITVTSTINFTQLIFFLVQFVPPLV